MNQQREKLEIAYDGETGLFYDREENAMGAREYIDQHLGHVLFNDFDIVRSNVKGVSDFIFRNRQQEYHIYVKNTDKNMIELLTNIQKKNGRYKIRTSKDVKHKLKKGYAIVGITSTLVVSGFAYALGSGMIKDTVHNVQTYMEEVHEEKEEREYWNKVAPIYNYLVSNYLVQGGTLEDYGCVSYNIGEPEMIDDEYLQETAKRIYNKIAAEQPEQLDAISSGGVLTEIGENFVDMIREDKSITSGKINN